MSQSSSIDLSAGTVTTTGSIFNGISGVQTTSGLIYNNTTTLPMYNSYPLYVYGQTPITTSLEPIVVRYGIYKVAYRLGSDQKIKSLVFAYQASTAPEIAIMNAADKAKITYIEILGIYDLGSTDIALTPNQQVKEIIL